ncbi:MAG: hypothetical protein JWO48_923 [Bryobacterales bacterium]|nr:hypothetical protein [Bryobacterales bacterium]
MTAELKRLHSPDVYDLRAYLPEVSDNFGFLLQAMIGPKGIEGEESFDIQVCTPKWLIGHSGRTDIILGRHYLIMIEYDYDRLVEKIASFCNECSGETWQEIAGRLSRLGKWEFEDYQPIPRT